MSYMPVLTWIMTKHATDRALDMALDAAEIRRAMYSPESVREVTRRDDCDWYYVAGRITLAVKAEGDLRIARTVLWSSVDAWRADETLPVVHGREPRETPLRALHKAS